MSNKTVTINFGFSTLFLIFLILKLTGHINWSWWWVTSPIWIPLIIALVAIVIYFYLKNKK